MSYTTEGIEILDSRGYDLGRIIRAQSSHADKYVQCYLSGHLVAWQSPINGIVEFVLAEPAEEDTIFLLAVDAGEETVNYWTQAFENASGGANRLTVQTPQLILSYRLGDRWKVYSALAGQSSADVLVHEQDFYPGGRRSGGWGKNWGYGGWGLGGFDCVGWGSNWGLGEWGFDCDMLVWTSDPMGPGTYPVKVTVRDQVGNESDPYETTIALPAAPRPASELTVTSYDKAADTITLTFTESEDVQ